MNVNKTNPYDVEYHIAEIYDKYETQLHDVKFILELIKKSQCKKILEPFCGTGRILLPIAEKGLKITGIDGSEVMLNQLHKKLKLKPANVGEMVKIIKADLTKYFWPRDYDLIILGGNCLFELSSLEEQELILRKAYNSLNSGGYIFIDNDNIENELPDTWCNLGVENESFPTGVCNDGTVLKGYSKTTYVDKKNKIWRARKRIEVYQNNHLLNEYEWEIQKHPIGYSEIVSIIEKLNLSVINVWNGTQNREKYTSNSNRATFWLQKNNNFS